MAEKKPEAEKTPAEKKKPTSAALHAAIAQLEEQETGQKKNTAILRVGAFVLWALAAVAMYMPQIGQLNLPFGAVRMLFLGAQTACIVDIIVAGVLVVLAAQLWKKANHIHPTKLHNPFLQFCWNQLGVLMAGIIFAPLAIILITKSDKIDEKAKKLVAAVLLVVFLGASAASADYHPVTQDAVNEVLAEAEEHGWNADTLVYFTKYGYKYHTYEDCQALKNSNTVSEGALGEVVEGHHTDVCSFCAARADAKIAAENAADALEDLAEGAENALSDLTDGAEDALEGLAEDALQSLDDAA